MLSQRAPSHARPRRRQRIPRDVLGLGLAVILVVVIAVVLVLVARRPQDHHYASASPNFIVSTTVDGHRISPTAKAIRRPGSHMSISTTIQAPAGVTVSNEILRAGEHAGDVNTGDTGTVLTQIPGSVPNGQPITATWVVPDGPSPQLVEIQFDYTSQTGRQSSTAREGRTLLTVTITS